MIWNQQTGRYVAGAVEVDGDVFTEAAAHAAIERERELGRPLTDAERQEIEAELLRPTNWSHLSPEDRGVA